jgi:hypothetical protein
VGAAIEFSMFDIGACFTEFAGGEISSCISLDISNIEVFNGTFIDCNNVGV